LNPSADNLLLGAAMLMLSAMLQPAAAPRFQAPPILGVPASTNPPPRLTAAVRLLLRLRPRMGTLTGCTLPDAAASAGCSSVAWLPVLLAVVLLMVRERVRRNMVGGRTSPD
jgi:hypothetical protein